MTNAKTVNVKDVKLNAQGLVPAIVIDEVTREVLVLAWMNERSLAQTIETGLVTFWSRSREELWVKGETSGNFLHMVSIKADCDRDALLIEARPDGPACHLGTTSCFNDFVDGAARVAGEVASATDAAAQAADAAEACAPALAGFTPSTAIDELMGLLAERKELLPEGSYTTYLFEKGLDKILKKVGEESTEVIIAAKDNDRKETVYEIADLTYHVMVLMTQMGISLDEVRSELAGRHVIDHKVKQEKMTS